MNRGVSLMVLAVLAAASLGARPAGSQDLGLRAYGFRGGISMNPDQFHFGVYADAGRLARRWRLQPSFELGLGNGVRVGAANLDVVHLFEARRWEPYAGAGLGINFIDVARGFGQDNGLDIKPVLNIVGGIEWGRFGGRARSSYRYLLEARFGIGDTPVLKVSAGLKFR